MRSTMQDAPLSIARLVRHGTVVHGASEVSSWTGDGFRTATYAEVGKRAARLANALRALGIDGDQRVATYQWNNQEHLEAYFAVPAMGAVLHTLNIRLFPEQVVFIANHAEDKVVIVDASLVEPLSKVLPEFETVEHVLVTGEDPDLSPLADKGAEIHSYESLLADASDDFDWVEVDENDAAAMCYTSGTTGNPKGVVYSHRSVVLHSMAACMGDAMGLSPSSKVLVIVPQFHAMAWGLPYAAMLVGAELVMPDRFLQPEPMLKMIQEAKPNFAGAVPTIWQGLLGLLEGDDEADISCLEEVVVGGSACPESLMRAFEEKFRVRILHAWGMTETSPLGSVARPPIAAHGEDAWRYRVTQGRFMAGVEARLIAEDGSVQPWDDEAVGELECRGPWITASYHLDDDDEKFHDGWLRTGDVGRISPDGFLTLTDRSKDVIKSGGEWISSVELENAIMGHPAVAEAAVIGIPDEKWGERPLASVVVKDGEDVSADDLRGFLADKVAKWQLPDSWAFIEEVPKTSVGKFDKKVIRQRFADEELEVVQAS
ncbi:MAG: long-chain fatty acid--CoA ligase [Solirubrobacteraceae bacterium]